MPPKRDAKFLEEDVIHPEVFGKILKDGVNHLGEFDKILKEDVIHPEVFDKIL